MASSETIAVLGAGSWGATLAAALADNGHKIRLWEFDAKAAESLAQTRHLNVLPELVLPKSIEVTSFLQASVEGASLIVVATPSHFVRSTMRALKSVASPSVSSASFVSVAKGIEDSTLSRMTEVIQQEIGCANDSLGALAGPSHAEEVCRRVPTALVAASSSEILRKKIQQVFSQEFLRVYTHDDLIGVELGGALKNIFAIACGISDGLALGDNTKAALMTRGLNEMARLGAKAGARTETFYGLTGMGDLIVTCLSQHSRNRSLGEKIGKGKTPQEALGEMTMVAEGYRNAKASHLLVEKYALDCPLISELYAVLYNGKNPRQSLRDLMSRETSAERKI